MGDYFGAAIIRSCSGQQICLPPRLLLPQGVYRPEQPWRLHPSISRFVTSPCPRYANRPIRATDGKRTFTSQESQPCRLLLSPLSLVSLLNVGSSKALFTGMQGIQGIRQKKADCFSSLALPLSDVSHVPIY